MVWVTESRMITTYQGTRERQQMRNAAGDKECFVCREWLPVNQFSAFRYAADELQIKCKECARKTQIRTKYGLTQDAYDALLAEQHGVCAICLDPPSEGDYLHVDHDHACCPGKSSCSKCIRGLLCRGCNTGLGHLRDNVDNMRRAIRYLESQNALSATA